MSAVMSRDTAADIPNMAALPSGDMLRGITAPRGMCMHCVVKGTPINHILDNLTNCIHDITLLVLMHVTLLLSSWTGALLISPSPSDEKGGHSGKAGP